MSKKLKIHVLNKSIRHWGYLPLLLTFTLSACSTLPPPVEQMAVTKSTVDRASSSPNAVEAAPVVICRPASTFNKAKANHEFSRLYPDKPTFNQRRNGVTRRGRNFRMREHRP